jgi:hypothetical protein
VVYEDDSQQSWLWAPPHQKEISTLEDILMDNFIATSSTMFRRGLFGEFPKWYYPMFPITDWPLHILNAEHGKIGYINEVMGVYRYHRHGFYSPLSETQKQEVNLGLYKTLNANLNFRYDKIIKTGMSIYFFEWAEGYEKNGDLDKARTCFKICLAGRPVNKFISLERLIGMWLRLYMPQFVRKQNQK